MDLISIATHGPREIDLRWRFEARLNVPGSPKIKPYYGSTRYSLNEAGMIVQQEVRALQTSASGFLWLPPSVSFSSACKCSSLLLPLQALVSVTCLAGPNT